MKPIMAKKAVAVVASLAVIVACVWFMLPRRARVPREQLLRPYVCEACGHRFETMVDGDVAECPTCHKKEAVHYYEYECRECGHRFEAFREKRAGEGAPSPDEPPQMVYRREGGKWVDMLEQLRLERLACPKCKSRKVGPPRAKAAGKP
jgi:DNA-directed RNA polymerase subunit RPC12/RpoP